MPGGVDQILKVWTAWSGAVHVGGDAKAPPSRREEPSRASATCRWRLPALGMSWLFQLRPVKFWPALVDRPRVTLVVLLHARPSLGCGYSYRGRRWPDT